jgi:flagellar biosynthesis protein FlhG
MPLPSLTPRRIAIASGKGGVGKTWFAITLAHVLARQARRVLLVDGDLGLANVDVQLGLMPARDLGSVMTGQCGLSGAVTRCEPGGFDVLAGRSGSGALSGLAPELIDRTMDDLRRKASGYEVMLLDLGAGIEAGVRRMAACADTLVVMATDEPTSLTDAYAVLKLHHADRPDGDVRVLVNQAATPLAGQRTHAALARACGTFLGFEPPPLGVVRRDDRVRDAIRRQTLLLLRHPTSVAGADVEAAARGLVT